MSSDACDVVICTFNRPTLTMRAVESILSQSHPHWNLWVVDDASEISDQRELQHSLEKLQDRRIVYSLLPKNGGPAQARNWGASLGSSPYVAFLDSDDSWHREKLIQQINFLKQNNIYEYVHCDEFWFKNGVEIFPQKIHHKQGGFFFERALKLCLMSPSAIMFRRGFWQSLDERFCAGFFVAEDYEFWLRLNFLYPAGYINEKLVFKYAGDWPQLSRRLEIDRQRVLALHRFYRRFHRHENFQSYREAFFRESFRKINILIKGAHKYNRASRLRQYQNWQKVFERLETGC